MNIVVWGGGLYGCHIATELANAGHTVSLYERSGELMSGAAKKNQHRLHQGWHYPRCGATSAQAAAAFQPFLEIYREACLPVAKNLYLLHRDSAITAEQYADAMATNSIAGTVCEIPAAIRDPQLYSKCWNTGEMCIDLQKLRYIAGRRLADANVACTFYVQDQPHKPEQFDFSINCTYTKSTHGFGVPLKYELCFLPLAWGPRDFPAITIMDGQYVSVYPTGRDNLWTVSSVARTPAIKTSSLDAAELAMASLTAAEKTAYVDAVWEHASQFVDLSGFVRAGHYEVIKTKIASDTNDYRGTMCLWGASEVSVIAGKLSGVVLASNEIKGRLK